MEKLRNSQHDGAFNHYQADADAIIIGGGISGICMAIKLIESGIKKIAIIEKSAGFGGTWRDNRYPGCRCDIPAHLYSYSFYGNPDWSRVYPDQIEILGYLTKVAAKYDLYQYARFSSAVESARWDERKSRWVVSIRSLGAKEAEFGSSCEMTAGFLLSAVGQLNVPNTPTIQGLDSFKGQLLHSARWRPDADLSGLRVGIVGNGATAVQIVPELAKVSARLMLFQRTANWVMPREDEEYPEHIKKVLRTLPIARKVYRSRLMQRGEDFWGPLTQMDTDASGMLRQWCLSHMHSQLKGREDLWAKVTPTYAPGCKRILISNDYYPSLLREDVDVITSGIDHVTERGVRTRDGKEFELDCLILATGFQTSELLNSFTAQGLRSRNLQDEWKKTGVQALYGIAAEDMPNFGMLYGPNTNLAHNSIILMIEAQARYLQVLVSKVVEARRKGGSLVIVPKAHRVIEYNDYVQKQLLVTSFNDSKCQSWYKDETGKVINNWGRNVVEYQVLLSNVRWSDYDMSGYGAKNLQATNEWIGRIVEEIAVRSVWLVGLTGFACLGLLGACFRGLLLTL